MKGSIERSGCNYFSYKSGDSLLFVRKVFSVHKCFSSETTRFWAAHFISHQYKKFQNIKQLPSFLGGHLFIFYRKTKIFVRPVFSTFLLMFYGCVASQVVRSSASPLCSNLFFNHCLDFFKLAQQRAILVNIRLSNLSAIFYRASKTFLKLN